MPIVTPQRKKQKKMIYLVILVVVITSVVVYFGILGNGIPGITIQENEFPPIRFTPKTTHVELNIDLLQDERFLELVPYEKIPTDIKTGRKNPFLPYSP